MNVFILGPISMCLSTAQRPIQPQMRPAQHVIESLSYEEQKHVARAMQPAVRAMQPAVRAMQPPGLYLEDISYISPPASGHIIPTGTILDRSLNRIYDCPTSTERDIEAPSEISSITPKEDPEYNNEIKQAKRIMKTRRRKMNRHKLKKYRKKYKFKIRKLKVLRQKRKDAVFQNKLQARMQSAHDFDALVFIKQEIEQAKRGGYKVDIYASLDKGS